MKKNFMKLIMLSLSLVLSTFISGSVNVQAAPVVMSDGELFDYVYYAENNPDVVAAFGYDPTLLYQHYVMCGKAEGRLPYDVSAFSATAASAVDASAGLMVLSDGTLFDPVYYGQNNPDVVAAFGNDYALYAQHYLVCGKYEGRKPSANASSYNNSSSNNQQTNSSTTTYTQQTNNNTSYSQQTNTATENKQTVAEESNSSGKKTYILNVRSKKFHEASCGSAATIKSENKRVVTATRDELLSQGYSPCGNCDP